MRPFATMLGLGTLVILAGCSSTRWGFLKGSDAPAPSGESGAIPSVAQLVDWLNNNADRIQSLRVDDLNLTCSQGIRTLDLRGTMIVEKPHDVGKPPNFRLGAKVVANPVVDLGSNEKEFWYWISKADPPYQFYCSYDDFEKGRVQRMPFPFQPAWVTEAMGLGPYGPSEKYTLEHTADTLKLVEKATSPQGAPVLKVIVFRRKPVPAGSYATPQVTDYLLLDANTGKEICVAHISETQIDQQHRTNAIVPKRMELRWPAEKLKLGLHMRDVTINAQVPPEVFVRRTMSGVQSFNLARMKIDNSPPPQTYTGVDPKVRQAQGLSP